MPAIVGFIGLGLMGQGFVRRLVETGHEVVGTDIRPEAMEQAKALGARVVADPASVARAADHVLMCVTTPAAVAEVVRGDAGILAAGDLSAKVLVDHSTTDIPLTRALGADLAGAGMGLVDAPVSGGPAAAETGKLAIMAGGADEDVARVRPILAHLGLVTHMGALGAGQAAKLVNQTLVLTNYCVIAEALRLAQAFGVDAQKIPDALAPGHAGSNLLPALMPRMAAEDFAPRGFARQVLKDLEMLHSATRDLPLSMPMAGQALSLFRLLVAGGKAELDGSAVVTLFPKSPAPDDLGA
jgi:3-hydroxyisobutyrate dehydrogenase-like beta-hydroxyacid dehydrogenase